MNEPPRGRVDQALLAGKAAAEAVHARGARLRAHVEANPGAFPLVEKHGLRAEDLDEGDPARVLQQLEDDLGDIERRHGKLPAPAFAAQRDYELKERARARREAKGR